MVACNTSTAVALPDLRRRHDVPILGVVRPGATAAALATRTRRVGVVATERHGALPCLLPGHQGRGSVRRGLRARHARPRAAGRGRPARGPTRGGGRGARPWPRCSARATAAARRSSRCRRPSASTRSCSPAPTTRCCCRSSRRRSGPGVAVIDSASATASALASLLEANGLGAPAGTVADPSPAHDGIGRARSAAWPSASSGSSSRPSRPSWCRERRRDHRAPRRGGRQAGGCLGRREAPLAHRPAHGRRRGRRGDLPGAPGGPHRAGRPGRLAARRRGRRGPSATRPGGPDAADAGGRRPGLRRGRWTGSCRSWRRAWAQPLPGVVERHAVVSPAGWARRQHDDLPRRCWGAWSSPSWTRSSATGTPLAGFAALANRFLATQQVGLMLGFLGTRVLGQYDVALLSAEAVPGRLLFVEENIRQAATAIGAPLDELRLWIALHETTHAFEFEAHAWLRPYLRRTPGTAARSLPRGGPGPPSRRASSAPCGAGGGPARTSCRRS